MRWFVFAAALLALTAATGCSSSGAAAIEGKVSYGGEPIDVGTITFIPKAEGNKTGGIIDSGAYSIDPKLGTAPGNYRVEIRWAKPLGKSSKNEYGEDIQMRREGLPEKYHDQSTLSAEIKAGKNVIDFALEK